MLRNLIVLCVAFIGLNNDLMGQDTPNQQGELHIDNWTDILEEIAEEGLDSREWSEVLSELHENPIPLNESTQEMLESIPFLSDYQIENLAYYLFRYAPMVSMSELLLIDGFDDKTIKWIKPFVCLGKSTVQQTPPTIQKIGRYGKQTLRTTFGRDLKLKFGSKDTVNGYLGDPNSFNLRYEFNYKNNYQFGILLDKDPSEPVWNRKTNRMDRIALHLVLKDQKRIKKLIVGEYTLRFGQGLICNNDFNMGKGSPGSSPESMGSTIKRHFSASTSPFFQGVAAQINLIPYRIDSKKKWVVGVDLTMFVSSRNLDSNTENGSFSTQYYTGLHRTDAELKTSSNLKQKAYGSRLSLRITNLAIGLNVIETRYNANRKQGAGLWNCYTPTGNSFYNASVDLRAHWSKLQLYSEVASDTRFRLAAIGGFSLQANSRFQLSMLFRLYDRKYHAEFGSAFSEGGKVSNEQGFYTTVAFQPFKQLAVKASCDMYRFPWLRQVANAPSVGTETCIQLEKAFGSKNLLIFRIKTKQAESTVQNENSAIRYIIPTIKNQFRLTYSTSSTNWSTKATIDMNRYSEQGKASFGWAMAQDLGYQTTKGFGIYAHFCLFQTDAYANRIYLFERSLPGSFSIPMLYGEGMKNSVYLSVPIKQIQAKLKYDWKSDDPLHSESRSMLTIQLSRKF